MPHTGQSSLECAPQPSLEGSRCCSAIPSPPERQPSSKGPRVIKRLFPILALVAMGLTVSPVWADEYQDTINVFRKAAESGRFFHNAYGYAVFPSVGKGGIGVGGAYGRGHVYEKGKYVGD